MDKSKTKVLVSILKGSALYESVPHDEKISLLLRLAEENPSLFRSEVAASNEYDLKQEAQANRDGRSIRAI